MLEQVVIQATSYCNISCSYCYLPGRDDKMRMSRPVLENTVRDVFGYSNLSPTVNFVWHAGEPTSVGVSFYEDAFTLIDQLNPGVEVKHRVQTNGVLLDERWCSFWRDKNVTVGLSVDGPAFLHDAERRTRSGRGTHVFAARAIESLKKHKVNFYGQCVLTQKSLLYPSEIIDFFIDREVPYVCFNLETVQGVNLITSLSRPESYASIRSFWNGVLLRIAERNSTISLREFNVAMTDHLLRREGGRLRPENSPMAILTVDVTGKYYTFSPELAGIEGPLGRKFSIGQAGDGGLDLAARSDALLQLSSEIKLGVEMCREQCRYFSVCGGGAPASKLAEHGTFAASETLDCRLNIKALFDFLVDLAARSNSGIREDRF